MSTITTREDARTALAQTHHWAALDEEQRSALTDWLWAGAGRALYDAGEIAERADDRDAIEAASAVYERALLDEVVALQTLRGAE